MISAKWENEFDYYVTNRGEWVSGQWLHLTVTWKTSEGISVYLNGCDMDPGSKKGYAYTNPRSKPVARWYPFKVGSGISGWRDDDGTTVDELYIWHATLDPMQIWQLYIQGGTMH